MRAAFWVALCAGTVACGSGGGALRSCPIASDTGLPVSTLVEVRPGDARARPCIDRALCRLRLRDGMAVEDAEPSDSSRGTVTVARVDEGVVTAWNKGEWGSGLTLSTAAGAQIDLASELSDADSTLRDGRAVRDSPIATVQRRNDEIWIVALRWVGKDRVAEGGQHISALESDSVVWRATVRSARLVGEVVARATGEAISASADGDGLLLVRRRALDRVDIRGAATIHDFADPLHMSDAGPPSRQGGDIFIPVRFGFVRVAASPTGSRETWLLPRECADPVR